MENGAIFPLFYLPPVAYFDQLLKNREAVVIETCEHFPKQTYRNRAEIYSPNGKLDLVVPVIKGSKTHTVVKDVRISYDFRWQRQHWLSLETCYRSSAYFEYYEADLMPFFEKKFDFLFDFNEGLLQLMFKCLKTEIPYTYTKKFSKEWTGTDFRTSIHPKTGGFSNKKPYFQVFEEKHGFLPNLSIVDLLFNQGPQSTRYL